MRQNLREIFTELIALADKVTVCVGVRRCGKSTLMQQQFQKLTAQGIPRENVLAIDMSPTLWAQKSDGWNA